MQTTEKALFQLIIVIGIISVTTLVLTILYMQGFIPSKPSQLSTHNEAMLTGLLNHTEHVENGDVNTTEVSMLRHHIQLLQQILKILNNSK